MGTLTSFRKTRKLSLVCIPTDFNNAAGKHLTFACLASAKQLTSCHNKSMSALLIIAMWWEDVMFNLSESESHLVVSNSLQPHGLYPTRLLCPWNSPGKNARVGNHSFLQGIFLTQGSNQGLLHHRRAQMTTWVKRVFGECSNGIHKLLNLREFSTTPYFFSSCF